MKFLPLLAIPFLAAPVHAGHRTTYWTKPTLDGAEVTPSHCVKDPQFGWNCWYKRVEKRRRHRHHHHHWGETHYLPWYNTTPVFRPNKYNHHGVPCYIYKDDNWCF